MKLRTFTILGVAGLTALSAAAGYTADLLDTAADQIAADQVAAQHAQPQDCMVDGIETAVGVVGCFTPVIAIIDESFFTTDDTMTEEGDAAE
jgi:hypothetical protein